MLAGQTDVEPRACPRFGVTGTHVHRDTWCTRMHTQSCYDAVDPGGWRASQSTALWGLHGEWLGIRCPGVAVARLPLNWSWSEGELDLWEVGS